MKSTTPKPGEKTIDKLAMEISELISGIEEESKLTGSDDFFEKINSEINAITDAATLESIIKRLSNQKNFIIERIQYFYKPGNPYKTLGLSGISNLIIKDNKKSAINDHVIDSVEISKEHKIEILSSISSIDEDKHLSTILARLKKKEHGLYIEEKYEFFYSKKDFDESLKVKGKQSLNDFILAVDQDAESNALEKTNAFYKSATFKLWEKNKERLNLIENWHKFKPEDITEKDHEEFLKLVEEFDQEHHIINLNKAKNLYQEKLDWVNNKSNLKKKLEEIQEDKSIHSIITKKDMEDFNGYFDPNYPNKIKQANNFIKSLEAIKKNFELMTIINNWNKLKDFSKMVEEFKTYSSCIFNIKSEYQKMSPNIESINAEKEKIEKLVEKISPSISQILSSSPGTKISGTSSLKPQFGAIIIELKSLQKYFLSMTLLFESIKAGKEEFKHVGGKEKLSKLTAPIFEFGVNINKEIKDAEKLSETFMDTAFLEENVKKYKYTLERMTKTGYRFEKSIKEMLFLSSSEKKCDKLVGMPIGYKHIIELLNETRERELKYSKDKNVDGLITLFKNARTNKLTPILAIINLIELTLNERSSYDAISLHLAKLETLVDSFLKGIKTPSDNEKDYTKKAKDLIKEAKKDIDAEFSSTNSITMTS